MATATTKPRVLGPGSLSITVDSKEKKFDADCINVQLEVDFSAGDSTTFLDGHKEREESTTDWKLTGTIKEDYSADSVQDFCFDNSGKEATFVFIPRNDQTRKFSGTLTVAPLGYGGDVASKNDQKFEFAVTELSKSSDNPVANA